MKSGKTKGKLAKQKESLKSNTSKLSCVRNNKINEKDKVKNKLELIKKSISSSKTIIRRSRNRIKEMIFYKKFFVKPKDDLLIKLYLRNGNQTEFFVKSSEDYFIYNEGIFLISDEKLDYDKSAKSYCLTYHEDCNLPFKIGLKTDSIRQTLDEAEEGLSLSANPKTLQRFIKSSIVEQSLSGSNLEKQSKTILLVVIVLIMLVVFNLLVSIFNTGLFSKG